MNISRLSGAVLLLCAASCARAGTTWTLTTADFNKVAVTAAALDDHSLHATGREGAMTVPIDRVLRLDREVAPAPGAGAYTLFMDGGDRLSGEIGDLKDDVLTWSSAVLGQMKVPIESIRAISRGHSAPRLGEERKEDQVTLTNHDVVRGVVSGIQAGKVLVQVNGDVSPVPLASVEAILLATGGKAKGTPGRAYQVRFIEGSRITAAAVTLSNGRLLLSIAGGSPREVDEANVLSIEQVNGPVRWLSAQIPVSSEHTPFSSESGFSAWMDRSVFDKPLRVGSQVFDRGVGVHANSKIVFALDGTYRLFRTRYGIDTNAEAGKADVNVRILLDGKPAHEQKHVRAFEATPVVSIELGAARQLTLEVTAAGPTDAQDRFDWVEAALVRNAPSATKVPATSPAKR